MVSGLAALLAMLSLSLLRMVAVERGAASARCAAAGSRLTAASGMDYAAARLVERPLPGRAGADSRGDDWSSRPSYRHGESWSGRLRGARGTGDLRFALKIVSTEGKIPLNAPSPPPLFDSAGPGLDLYVTGLVFALDNLGAVLKDRDGNPLVGTRRTDVPTSGDPYPISYLGRDLLRSRPAEGYRSWGQVERTLMSLPNAPPYEGAPYTKAELDAIRPFLCLGPYETLGESCRSWLNGETTRHPYAPISFWTASREVLQSLLLHVCGDLRPFDNGNNDLPGESGASSTPCPHSGLPFRTAIRMLWPEEAEAVADAAVAYRAWALASGAGGWLGFRRYLSDSAASLFQRDAAALSGFPVYRRSWLQMKANIAFQAVAMDPFPAGAGNPPDIWTEPSGYHLATWAAWGLDQPILGGTSLYRILHPRSFLGCDKPLSLKATGANRVIFLPTYGLTMGPPVLFEVASSGRASGAASRMEGLLRAGERLELASQEDFEGFSGWRNLARKGICVVDDPPAYARLGAASPTSASRVSSLPSWCMRSEVRSGCFPRSFGALALSPADPGRDGAQLFWPFVMDFDGIPNVPRPAWTELWAESDPAPVPPWSGTVDPLGYSWTYRGVSMTPYWSRLPDWFSWSNFWPRRMNLPGFRTSAGAAGWDVLDPVRTMTFEAWMTPASEFEIDRGFGRRLFLATSRGSRDPRRPGTLVRLGVGMGLDTWGSPFPTGWLNTSGYQCSSLGSWLVEDDPDRPTWHLHVRMTLELLGTGMAEDPHRTLFRVRVNGSDASADGPMELIHDGRANAPSWAAVPDGSLTRGYNGGVSIEAVDKVRLYDGLREGDVPERFVPEGSYTSPLFVPDGRTEIREAQWTGAVPRGMDPSAIQASVTGCWDAGGLWEAATVPLPTDLATDLKALGMPAGIRSFRYRVFLRRPPGWKLESPVFESIWLRLLRRGSAPAWTAWESR